MRTWPSAHLPNSRRFWRSLGDFRDGLFDNDKCSRVYKGGGLGYGFGDLLRKATLNHLLNSAIRFQQIKQLAALAICLHLSGQFNLHAANSASDPSKGIEHPLAGYDICEQKSCGSESGYAHSMYPVPNPMYSLPIGITFRHASIHRNQD